MLVAVLKNDPPPSHAAVSSVLFAYEATGSWWRGLVPSRLTDLRSITWNAGAVQHALSTCAARIELMRSTDRAHAQHAGWFLSPHASRPSSNGPALLAPAACVCSVLELPRLGWIPYWRRGHLRRGLQVCLPPRHGA